MSKNGTVENLRNGKNHSNYDVWSINNAFMGPILFGSLGLVIYGYTIIFRCVLASLYEGVSGSQFVSQSVGP